MVQRWRGALLLSGILLAEMAALGAPQRRPPSPKLPRDADIDSRWIYDDAEKGQQEARKTGKPLLVLVR